jgi:putative nucleotidyltransferase with HDIG domain
LPSLGIIDSALHKLLGADQSYSNSQIAEIIRHDPSLATRLLRLVHAVHYGLDKPPTNIDEAVFYLGIRQIRQLAMVTQIIEEFHSTAQESLFPWPQFWRHSIATAVMTHEIVDALHTQDDEIDYVAGLVHDVGKIVMAAVFPDHFAEIQYRQTAEGADLLQLEREVLGVDHADLGAMYLRKQKLPEMYVEIVQFHHAPQLARYQTRVTAAVNLADMLVRHHKIGDSGNRAEVPLNSWYEAPAWKILFGDQTEAERTFTWTGIQMSLDGVPAILEKLI